MVNTEQTAGASTYLLYGVETTYGVAASTIDQHLGLIQTTNPGKINRNVQENRGLKGTTTGGQSVANYTLGTADAGFSAEYNVYDWDFLQYVIGSRTGSGTGASPYIYSEDNQVSSLTFSGNIDNETTDRNVKVLGTKFNSVTIAANVGSPVSVTADFIAGNLSKDSTLQSAVALPSNELINFSGTDLEIPDTTSISNIIDNIEIVITRNAESQYGLGSGLAKNCLFKERSYRINFTVKYLDDDLVEFVMGGSSVLTTLTETTLTVKFDNGTNRTSDFKFTGVVFPEFDKPETVNEILTEGLTAFAKNLEVTEQVSA